MRPNQIQKKVLSLCFLWSPKQAPWKCRMHVIDHQLVHINHTKFVSKHTEKIKNSNDTKRDFDVLSKLELTKHAHKLQRRYSSLSLSWKRYKFVKFVTRNEEIAQKWQKGSSYQFHLLFLRKKMKKKEDQSISFSIPGTRWMVRFNFRFVR